MRGRFFLEGDGQLTLANKKTGRQATIRYRAADGSYPEARHKEVDRIFGVPAGSPEGISLRFISLLDYLQDHFKGVIHIVSGYRSPTYNENLRRRGRLAAKTSLHIEGMAADIDMAGISGEDLWHYVRSLNCCGAGYYHGKGIHVDSGPVRFWDETSTKVETDISTHNKLVMVQTDKDIYLPGEPLLVNLSRITDYPIGITLTPIPSPGTGEGGPRVKTHCQILTNRSQTKNIPWPFPASTSTNKKTHITVEFCQKPFAEMPDKISSNEFVLQSE